MSEAFPPAQPPEPPSRQAGPRRHRLHLRAAKLWLVSVAVVLVVTLVVVTLQDRSHAPLSGPKASPAPAAVVALATNVGQRTSTAVGRGTATTAPIPVHGAGRLSRGGLPEVVYVTSEFCPYCAAEAWPLVVALARFGHFSHLGQAQSSPHEVFGDTGTFSFFGTAFSSPYLAFSGTVEYGNETQPGGAFVGLGEISPSARKLIARLNSGGYAEAQDVLAGTMPFLDIANRYLVLGSQYSPAVIAGSSLQSTASSLSNARSSTTQAVVGAANELTAALCAITKDRPGSACHSPGVRAAARAL